MDKIVLDLEANETPNIIIESVGGDLRLSGWDHNQVTAEGDEHSLRLEKNNGGMTLRASQDCTLRVPHQTIIMVQNVGGDARAKSLDGQLTINTVGGTLTLRQTGAVVIGSVGGDVSAKKLAGPLRAGKVGGDLWARGVNGAVTIAKVGGDLYLRDAAGSVTAEVGGNVTLNVDPAAGNEYAVSADGDLVWRLPPGAAGSFDIQARGDILIDVPSAQIEGEPGHKVVTLGEGGPQATLRARGEAMLSTMPGDADSLGDFGERFGEDFGVMAEEIAAQIESQIESQMADVEKQLGERLAGLNINLGSGQSRVDNLTAQARRVAERVEAKTRRMEEKSRRKAEAAQHKAERAQRLAEAAGRRASAWAIRFDGSGGPRPPMPPRSPMPPRPPTPPSPPGDPVSDEERMMILRMVEQGKISVADAEKLLSALETR